MIDPKDIPRFAGITTFMRMPHERDLDDVDADIAFVGVPYDDGTTNRPGARFGPRAIRESSTLLSPYNPVTETNLQEFTIVDNGDASVVPGYTVDTFERAEDHLSHIVDNGILPAIAGGDHGITLPALRAVADEHGPLSLVQFDAHSDLWTQYFGKEYNHGTTFHHAIEEGLIDPETSIRIGDRGGIHSVEDVEMLEDSGIAYYDINEFAERGVGEMGEIIRERVDGATYTTIDIDAVDAAFAPGTGTPMPGGMTSREILRLTRQLAGIDIKGFDLVEVSPPYDTRSMTTSILAANIIYEMISTILLTAETS